MGNRLGSYYAQAPPEVEQVQSHYPSKQAREILTELYNLCRNLDQYPLLSDRFVGMIKQLTVDDLNLSIPEHGTLLHVLSANARAQPSLDAMRALIEMKVNCNIPHPKTGLGPLDSVCIRTGRLSSESAVQILIEAGANVNAVGKDTHSVLTRTIDRYIETSNDTTFLTIRMLIEAGADINFHAEAYNSMTPLLIACRKANRSDFIGFLIERGAHVNCCDVNLNTPLHYLSLNGWNPQTFALLLKHGANINAQNKQLKTPLLLASEVKSENQHVWIRTLITNGADVTHVDSNGNNALVIALLSKAPQQVESTLINAGVDIFQKNNNGEDVYMWMVQKYGPSSSQLHFVLREHTKSLEHKPPGIDMEVKNEPIQEEPLKRADSNPNICSICFEPLSKQVWTTPCGHQYCAVCFATLVKSQSVIICPLCRRELFLKN